MEATFLSLIQNRDGRRLQLKESEGRKLRKAAGAVEEPYGEMRGEGAFSAQCRFSVDLTISREADNDVTD